MDLSDGHYKTAQKIKFSVIYHESTAQPLEIIDLNLYYN